MIYDWEKMKKPYEESKIKRLEERIFMKWEELSRDRGPKGDRKTENERREEEENTGYRKEDSGWRKEKTGRGERKKRRKDHKKEESKAESLKMKKERESPTDQCVSEYI